MAMRIVQIVPIDGWYAKYHYRPGPDWPDPEEICHEPLICLALVEELDDPDNRYVVGIDTMGEIVSAASPYFVSYVHLSQLKAEPQ